MKVVGLAKFEDNSVQYPLSVGSQTIWIRTDWTLEDWTKQKTEPVKGERVPGGDFQYTLWLFRDYAISAQNMPMSHEDMVAHIKHFVYTQENKFSKIKKEVERFEKFENLNPASLRVAIPEEVRMYVWRRDGGKCVQCGSNRDLEYDHIVPVSEGGSSTERNVQLLCSPCNKKKSNKV